MQHGEALSGDEQKDMKHDQLLQELEKMEQVHFVYWVAERALPEYSESVNTVLGCFGAFTCL